MKKLFSSLAFVAVALLGALGVSSVAHAAQVRVEWSNVTGNQGYVIEAKEVTCATAGTFAQIGTTATNVTVFIGGTFPDSTAICVRVAALVGGVPQTFSGGTNYTTPAGLLPAPGTVNVTSP